MPRERVRRGRGKAARGGAAAGKRCRSLVREGGKEGTVYTTERIPCWYYLMREKTIKIKKEWDPP